MTELHQVKMRPDELSDEARGRIVSLLLDLLDCELNKKQTEAVYIHFPTPEENREAARERGFQGKRIEEICALVSAFGEDPAERFNQAMLTVEGSPSRPAFFHAPIEDWEDLLVFRYLRDRARAWWGLGLMGGDFVPLAIHAARVFMNCALGSDRPVVFASWTAHQIERLKFGCAAGKGERIQASVSRWFPLAHDLISALSDPTRDRVLGISSRSMATLQAGFRDQVATELASLGLRAPPVDGPADDDEEKLYLNGAAPLEPLYREKLTKILKMHVSSEYTTAFIEKLNPPSASDVAEWLETIREEGEHGEGMVDILSDLGEHPQAVIDDMRYGDGAYLLDFFKVEIESWDEVGIMRWLSERAAGYQSIAALGSNYIPFAAWSARNYIDEGMNHAGVGKDIVAQALEHGRKQDVQRLLLKRYPLVLDYFGSERPQNELLSLGIKMRTNRELRRRWIADQERETLEFGLAMPEDPLQGIRGHY